jgi:hypothetical protein
VGFKGKAHAEKLCGAYVTEIPDHRVAGLVTFRLDEILLATLALVLREAEDFDAIELSSLVYVT